MAMLGHNDNTRQAIRKQPDHRLRHRHGRFACGDQSHVVPRAQVVCVAVHPEGLIYAPQVTVDGRGGICRPQRGLDKQVELSAKVGVHGAGCCA